MADNEKIYTLIEKQNFDLAKKVAESAKIPEELIGEIVKEHADKLFQQKKYDEAILQYIDTIGFLNPSYVIQKFLKVKQLDCLIRYLEVLIRKEKEQPRL